MIVTVGRVATSASSGVYITLETTDRTPKEPRVQPVHGAMKGGCVTVVWETALIGVDIGGVRVATGDRVTVVTDPALTIREQIAVLADLLDDDEFQQLLPDVMEQDHQRDH